MKAVLKDGQEVVVWWEYPNEDGGKKTICWLDLYQYPTEPEPIRVINSIAYCNSSDRFVKETGRKLSLTRAIKKLNIDRLDRERIWQAYFNRKQSQVKEF